MKIAVAVTEDGKISAHFGRSSSFTVFTVEDGEVKERESRENVFTRHVRKHDMGQEGGGPNMIVEAFKDCDYLLCGGMGKRAADALSSAGVKPVTVTDETNPEEVVKCVICGDVDLDKSDFCTCKQSK